MVESYLQVYLSHQVYDLDPLNAYTNDAQLKIVSLIFSGLYKIDDKGKVTNITLAVPRSFKNQNGEYDTDFLDCTLWTNVAENTVEYCQTGDMVGVKGRIQSKIFEDEDGKIVEKTELKPFSLGMGGIGLPGDLSSASRFVRAAFAKLNSVSSNGETESVTQFFHILSAVAQQRGLTQTGKQKYEITIYSSCCNADKGIYYYTTYENSRISAVNMYNCNLKGTKLYSYPLVNNQQFFYQN